jgi:hypothetical protein
MERRNSPRARCRLRCELTRLHQRADGTVLDISEGGLSVHTQLAVEQGEPVLVQIEVPKQGHLELETIVWHIRRGHRRDTGEPFNLLGLMVSKAPAAYFSLLPDTAPHEPRELERTPEPEPQPLPDSGTDPPEPEPQPLPDSGTDPPEPEPQPLPDSGTDPPELDLHPFRIRIKARSGPRTRVLSLSAESESEARALAMSELDDEWQVLEVRSA